MTSWIDVPLEQLSRPTQEFRERGLQSFRSPFDVPAAIRSRYDASARRLAIEFAYLGSEETEASDLDHSVKVDLGRNSHRVYRIEFGLDEHITNEIIQQIVADALSRLRKRYRDAPIESYDAAQAAVELERGLLFQDLASSREPAAQQK
jgi:hypothetical protein